MPEHPPSAVGPATGASDAADDEAAAVRERLSVLDGVLAAGLRRPPLTFDRLIVWPAIPRFDPGPLALPEPAPHWPDFAPDPPRGLGRLLFGAAYRRRLGHARVRFAAARGLHQQRTAEQRRAIAVAKARFDHAQTQQRAQVAARNAYLAGRRAAVLDGEPDAVQWFTGLVLRASSYPEGFPREFRVAYRPENRDVVVELELPVPGIVPDAGGQHETRRRYERLICAVALRTLHEIFGALPAGVVAAAVVNGRVTATDPGTGKPARPFLLSVSAERAAVAGLVLAAVDPVACLARLDAVLSPDPCGARETEPIVTLDQVAPAGQIGQASGTGQAAVACPRPRPNLLRIARADFEQLLRRLFLALGARTWTVTVSADGDVNAVITGRPGGLASVIARQPGGAHAAITGGLGGADAVSTGAGGRPGERFLVRACRRRQAVELACVVELAEAMTAQHPAAAIMVTTSWFTRAAEVFARHNQIRLVGGAELAWLVGERLGADVLPGVSPPRRLAP